MQYRTIRHDTATIRTALFNSGRREMHAIITAGPDRDFRRQLADVRSCLDDLMNWDTGLRPVFLRYFLSDPANQIPLLPTREECAASAVGQAPLDGSKVALWTIMEEDADFHDNGNGRWSDSRGRIWTGDTSSKGMTSHDMTEFFISSLAEHLENTGASLLDHCIRTWFIVRDIDLNYAGVVEGRNEQFSRLGLCRDTHFITSTGIGGFPADGSSVAFNALCDTRLRPGQMNYLYGSTHLNPTAEYGVAFERGTTVDYADRRHVYISGTASIDNRGRIMFPGDIAAQTRRMIENIRVLLAEGGCSDRDIAHFLVYLRDPGDRNTVGSIFSKEFPDIPRVMVLAPVCRPGWLVETECMAVRSENHPGYAAF